MDGNHGFEVMMTSQFVLVIYNSIIDENCFVVDVIAIIKFLFMIPTSYTKS